MTEKVRLYFYRENDVLKKYTYCSLCGAGPFTESEKHRGEIKHLAGDRGSEINYCRQCMFNQGLLVDIKDEKIIEQQMLKTVSNEDVSIKTTVKQEIKQQTSVPQNGSLFVYMMEGADGILFCHFGRDIEEHIKDVNKGTVKHAGIRLTSYPFVLVYKRAVNDEIEATSFVKIIRTLPKAFKVALIDNYKKSIMQSIKMKEDENEY